MSGPIGYGERIYWLKKSIDGDKSGPNRPETPTTEEEKLLSEIKNLAGSGKSVNQIIKALWPEITGGRKWMEKSKQIKEVLGKVA